MSKCIHAESLYNIGSGSCYKFCLQSVLQSQYVNQVLPCQSDLEQLWWGSSGKMLLKAAIIYLIASSVMDICGTSSSPLVYKIKMNILAHKSFCPFLLCPWEKLWDGITGSLGIHI